MYTLKTDSTHWNSANIYGSSRVGMYEPNKLIGKFGVKVTNSNNISTLTRGLRRYELSNHLGNVLAVISDKRTTVCNGVLINYYEADIVYSTDYHAFGSSVAGRSFSNSSYKYGFNGQEKDNELAGEGNSYSAEFWQYDSRLGRRFNIDPRPITSISVYACFNNNPIWLSDVKGDSSVFDNKGNKLHYDVTDKDLRVFMKEGDKLTLIGELGKKVDINKIFSNILKENKNEVKGGFFKMTPISWFIRVKKDGKWDYKDNLNTIFGIAWSYDQKNQEKNSGALNTNFKYKNLGLNRMFNAADVGNYNAGFTGTLVGLWPIIQKIGAGYVEQNKQGKPFKPSLYTKEPYGDRPRDYYFNCEGMLDAQKEIENDPKPIFFK